MVSCAARILCARTSGIAPAMRVSRSSVGGGTSCTPPEASSTPQSGQKRNSALTLAPHARHCAVARAPQAWQKRLPEIRSVPQLAQRMAPRYAPRYVKSTASRVRVGCEARAQHLHVAELLDAPASVLAPDAAPLHAAERRERARRHVMV